MQATGKWLDADFYIPLLPPNFAHVCGVRWSWLWIEDGQTDLGSLLNPNAKLGTDWCVCIPSMLVLSIQSVTWSGSPILFFIHEHFSTLQPWPTCCCCDPWVTVCSKSICVWSWNEYWLIGHPLSVSWWSLVQCSHNHRFLSVCRFVRGVRSWQWLTIMN